MHYGVRRWTATLTALVGLLCSTAWAIGAAGDKTVTFTESIAPIFLKKCASCHRPGEIAPMSLLTYEQVRPWAKSIRQAVITRAMPPWPADRAHGRFTNDISLSQSEIETIVRWVDQGARKGDPEKMPQLPQFAAGWKLGEPDYVIDLGTLEVPASGPDVFLDRHFRLNLPEDRWVRAVEIQAGNRTVLHHLVAIFGNLNMSGSPTGSSPRRAGGGQIDLQVLSVWAAGTPPTVFPEGMGRAVKKDQELTFNLHFHPSGRAATDHSKVGIYFGKGTVKKTINTGFAANSGILIPAGSDNVEYSASYVFGKDSRIVSFFPHMHLRGKDMTYTLTYPDGRREILLSVPRYDFHWQW
ncbi:MAG: thiol-disulfide isomerase, partial [Blastocatellia bacterium]